MCLIDIMVGEVKANMICEMGKNKKVCFYAARTPPDRIYTSHCHAGRRVFSEYSVSLQDSA
jgi:hypothetical protein